MLIYPFFQPRFNVFLRVGKPSYSMFILEGNFSPKPLQNIYALEEIPATYPLGEIADESVVRLFQQRQRSQHHGVVQLLRFFQRFRTPGEGEKRVVKRQTGFPRVVVAHQLEYSDQQFSKQLFHAPCGFMQVDSGVELEQPQNIGFRGMNGFGTEHEGRHPTQFLLLTSVGNLLDLQIGQ